MADRSAPRPHPRGRPRGSHREWRRRDVGGQNWVTPISAPPARATLKRGPRRAPHRRRAGSPLPNFVAGSCGRGAGRTPATAARPPVPTELLSAAATPPVTSQPPRPPPPFIINPGFCRRRRPPPLAEGREGADAARAAANQRRRRARPREAGARPRSLPDLSAPPPPRRAPIPPVTGVDLPGEYRLVIPGRFPARALGVTLGVGSLALPPRIQRLPGDGSPPPAWSEKRGVRTRGSFLTPSSFCLPRTGSAPSGPAHCYADVVAARVRLHPVSHPRFVSWGSRPAQSCGEVRGALGELNRSERPCPAGNSLRVFGSDVRCRSRGTAVWDAKLRPDMRDANAESAAAFGSSSDGLSPAFPRMEGGEELLGPRWYKSRCFPGIHQSPVPHPKGKPARGQPVATEHRPLRPDGSTRPSAAPRAAGGSQAYGLPSGFRHRCCAQRPVREQRRRARKRCRAARVRWAAVAAAPVVPDGRPARTRPEAAPEPQPRCQLGWQHGGKYSGGKQREALPRPGQPLRSRPGSAEPGARAASACPAPPRAPPAGSDSQSVISPTRGHLTQNALHLLPAPSGGEETSGTLLVLVEARVDADSCCPVSPQPLAG
ncbi:basic proline-rich protein-like [Corapipo altera]|uniref:basic proline-rich protein-like n=1 Tax=Corapipo altera TaxID=415028 RepID=UPI000FD6B07F|nr:basic proline-rich protein-like [Corapipo altera]